jgi:HD-like signal output (HDOD) protein
MLDADMLGVTVGETSMQLETLLKRPNALPSAPKTVRQLMGTFGREDVDVILVARLVQEDPVLVARLLKTANSAYFGLRRSVGTVSEAINVLGVTKVRALVVAAALDQGFQCVCGVNLGQFWRYSMNTAKLSHQIAAPTRVDEDTAFTAGLVHGIGELVMHVGMPEAMTELDLSVPMLDLRRCAAQQDRFGYSFAQVGAALAAEWKFPKEMIGAIEYQASPFGDGVHEPIAGVLHIASWRTRAQELSLGGDALVHTYPDTVGVHLGLDPDILIGDDMLLAATQDAPPAPVA